MAATTNSLFNLHQIRIEEVINKNIEMFMPSIDPVYRDMIASSQGVIGPEQLGRDMRIIRVYMGSMAGVIDEGAANYQDVTLYGDQTTQFGAKLHEQNLTQTWPNPLDGANASPYELFIPMRSMMTTLMHTLGEKQAEATPAFIGQVIEPKLRGFARNIAQTLCNYWYVSQNSSYRLCTITSVSTSGATVTFSPNNQAVDRFAVGQRVDIYAAAGTVRANDTEAVGANQDRTTRIKLYVSKVSELNNLVELTASTAVAAWGGQASVANGDLVVMANTGAGASPTFKGIAGIRSWMKFRDGSGSSNTNTNTLLGGEAEGSNNVGKINVNIHPEFESALFNTTGPLTEHYLRKVLRRWHTAKNKYGQYIDTLIASDGVWLAYEGTKIGRQWEDRTGRLSNINNEGSAEGFKFHFDGRTYEGHTSTYIESQTLYGIRKGGNNWKKVIPPDPKGTRNFDQSPSFAPFRFVAPALYGTDSVSLPIFASSSGDAGSINLPTEGSQLPGMIRLQIVPDQPAALLIQGMDEDRIYPG